MLRNYKLVISSIIIILSIILQYSPQILVRASVLTNKPNLNKNSINNHIIYDEDVLIRKRDATNTLLNISYQTKWFSQRVDHFSWSNQDTFQQRYLVNSDHFKCKNCPILFYTGNEGDIELFTNNTGFMWDIAPKLNALLVFAEHRFYGKSMPYDIDPTKVSPNVTEQLGFLTSEQALADFSELIYQIKHKLYDAQYSPVIVIGGSYGGMLSAWMRMKYPQLITGALAGSAPIFQFNGTYECSTFMQIVTQDFENYSKNCSRTISESWMIMRQMALSESGLHKLSEAFNTCEPLRDSDIDSLLGLLNDIWVNLAMTDYANKASFLSNLPAYPIKHVCQRLSKDPASLTKEELVNAIGLASQVYSNYTGTLKCLDIEKIIHDPMDTMWNFQTCTEMVMPICSDGINDMFEPHSFNLDSFVSSCQTEWGVTTEVNKISVMYGLDKSLPSTSNIIFSSCSRDPWSAGCPQDSYPDRGIHAIKIDGACHHEDLRPIGVNDTEPVKAARRQELDIIADWISAHYATIRRSLGNLTLGVESSTSFLKWDHP